MKLNSNKISTLLLLISIISLLINNFAKSNFLIVGIPLLIAIITYIISMILISIDWLKKSHNKSDNPIKTIKFNKEYFDKTGYALFTGGIITLVTTKELVTSSGLIIIGVSCIIISIINQKRYERFKELIKNK